MKAIVLVGLPGSGKSTLADNLVEDGWEVVSADSVRADLYKDAAVQGNPAVVWGQFFLRLRLLTLLGAQVVVDNTNCKTRDRLKVLEFLRESKYSVEYWLVDTPLDECLRRNKARSRRVPEAVIHRMHSSLEAGRAGLLQECSTVIIRM